MGCCFGSPSYETPPLQAVSVWLSDPANDNDDTTKKHLAPAAHIDVHGQLVDDAHGGRVFDEAYYTARHDAQAAADAMRAAAAEADAAYNRGAKADAHKCEIDTQLHLESSRGCRRYTFHIPRGTTAVSRVRTTAPCEALGGEEAPPRGDGLGKHGRGGGRARPAGVAYVAEDRPARPIRG